MDIVLDKLTTNYEIVRFISRATPKTSDSIRKSSPCAGCGCEQFNRNNRGSLLRPQLEPRAEIHHRQNAAERAKEQRTIKPLAGRSMVPLEKGGRKWKRGKIEAPKRRASSMETRAMMLGNAKADTSTTTLARKDRPSSPLDLQARQTNGRETLDKKS